ncbi:MAG: glycosyltransferase family 8 protein [Planctomycetia bacterium]|nr:glycosyltransferase family 8 protein [Planctomycetia bacterium]
MLRSFRLVNPADRCEVYLLHNGVAADNLARLTTYLRSFLDAVHSVHLDTTPLQSFRVDGHVSLATYFRLLIPDALPPSVERLVFLDCDMIVVDSLGQLWNTDLRGAPIGAVEHLSDPEDLRRLGLRPEEGYFNAGLLLIDLGAWRARGIIRAAKDFYARYPEKVRWWDQDVLNGLFRGQWSRLHPRWNALPQLWTADDSFRVPTARCPESLLAVGGPAVVHFAGGGACKPWNYHCRHPYRDDYLAIAETTPWGRGRLEDTPTVRTRIKAVLGPVVTPVKTWLRRVK